MKLFDLVVLGGGPAGYHAAKLAASKGMDTVLIEAEKIGGICLNEGCIPLKTFLHSSKLFDDFKTSRNYGIYTKEIRYEHADVLSRKNVIVKKLTAAVEFLLKEHNVTIFKGFACIKAKEGNNYTITINDNLLITQKILIATGSSPVVLNVPGIQDAIHDGFVIFSKDALETVDVPKKFVVIGGGFIGIEFASYFSSIGSEVTIIERLDHVGGSMDFNISKILEKNLEKQGIKIFLNTEVSAVTNGVVGCKAEKKSFFLECDKILMSVGRKANVNNIGLEQLGIKHVSTGIVTDEYMSTNVEGVFAAGDVNGKSMLAHTAYREAEVAINNMTGRRDLIRYNTIPSVIFSNPEVAFVGFGEEQATSLGLQVAEIKIPLRYSGRYMAEVENGDGICKIIIDKRTHRLLGVHMIGKYVSEIIYGAAFMIETEYRIRDLQELVFPHPTVGEAFREALFMYKGGIG